MWKESFCADERAKAEVWIILTLLLFDFLDGFYICPKLEPDISVSVLNKKLSENKDYTLTYSNNINVGEAKIRITGIGDYSKFASVATFTIVTRNISKATISEIKTQKYTGKAVEPSLTITDNGRYLKEGTDYKVYYNNNTNLGKANVSVVGIGNYSGSVATSFEIAELDVTERITNFIISLFEDFFAKLTSFILNFGFMF